MPFLRQFFLRHFDRNWSNIINLEIGLIFIFLLHKMDNKVINKKAEIEEIVRYFKQNLELKTTEMSKRRLKILKGCIKRNKKIVNDKDETDIEYINDELNNIKIVFESFCSMYNIDYIQKTTDDSTFDETTDQIKNKKCAINPKNKDNKCFQYSITTYLYHKAIKCHPKRM